MEDNNYTPMEIFKIIYNEMYDVLGCRNYSLDEVSAQWLECIAYSLAVIAEKMQEVYMDEKAKQIVKEYMDGMYSYVRDDDIYIVWKCKTLQNWKWLISSEYPDHMYYEVTYNGDKAEFYLDCYKKLANKVTHMDKFN